MFGVSYFTGFIGRGLWPSKMWLEINTIVHGTGSKNYVGDLTCAHVHG